VLLFEMLCGRAPFLESEPVALAMAHVGKKPPAPRSLREDLADSVSDAILKGLAKVPQQRHTDLAAMALALGVPM
jgi:serine/threonine protein kinase